MAGLRHVVVAAVVVIVVVEDVVVVVAVVVVLAVLTLLARTVTSVVTGQAPVALEWRNSPGKKHKQTGNGTRVHRS